MTKNSRLLIFVLFAIMFNAKPVFSQDIAEIGNIEVTIQNIDVEEEGELLIMLFNSESSWLEAGQYYKIMKVLPENETQIVVFEEIPYSSTYAIEIIHDENDNQKVDMRILPYPKPKEGFGVSNNTFRAGPPEYEKANFVLDQPKVGLTIQMKY